MKKKCPSEKNFAALSSKAKILRSQKNHRGRPYGFYSIEQARKTDAQSAFCK